MANGKIIEEILSMLPKEKISDAVFEGANIVLYTKDKEFFFDNKGLIKKVVDDIKKRVELRPDPSITLDPEKAEKIIKDMMPEDAVVSDITFDPQRSRVIIDAEKPGIAIGKQGGILHDIREKTLWVPLVRRTPAIKCDLIKNIRAVLYQNSEYRRKFLHQVGQRIYEGWVRERRKEWIRLSFMGAGRQVGRSCLLLQTPESRVILDCGINVAAQGEEQYPHIELPEFNINDIDAIVVTHCHIDHCGFVPYLFKYGYRGPVYCTKPTRDIMSLLLLDTIKIAQSEGQDPLFSQDDVKEMVKHTICLEFEEVTDITHDVRLTLYNAGHTLGSSMAHLHVGNGLHNLLYTADLKYANTNLLQAAHTNFPRLETLIIESTYGGRDNITPPKRESDDYLKAVLNDTINRGGKVLMPVLGSGRAQEVMIIIENLMRTKQIPEVPVFIDGMVWDITAIHTAYPEYLNANIRKNIFHRDQNPFLAESFRQVGSQKERKQVIEDTGSCIILATSGMLVGGPSVEYLKNLSTSSKHSLIFTCYQGDGSLGQKIQRGEKELVFGSGRNMEVYELKMEVHKVEITQHSDRKELMNFVANCNPRPKRIIIQHGEPSRCLDLASSLHKQFRVETNAPRNIEALRLK